MVTRLSKIYRALGPLAGGIILDLFDIATFGPLGIYAGWLVGYLVGWWITSFYSFKASTRFILASLAAIYLTIPMTELIPVATVVSALARYRGASDNS